MRVIFLLLLLLNVTLGGWGYWHYLKADSSRVVPAEKAAELQGGLRLLQELSAAEKPGLVSQQQPNSTTEDESVATAEESSALSPHTESILDASCYRIADIGRKEQRDALAAKISALDIAVVGRGEEFIERQTYWVYIPPLKNNATAREVVAGLVKAKVRDYLLVRSGEHQNAISLGVFSQRDGAEKRLQEIEALKLKAPQPVMRPHVSTYRSYWLLIRDVENQGEAALLPLLQVEKRVATSIDCPE